MNRTKQFCAGILVLLYCFLKGKTAAQMMNSSVYANVVLLALFCFLAYQLWQTAKKKHHNASAKVTIQRKTMLAIGLLFVVPLVLLFVAAPLCTGMSLSLLGNVALSTVTSFGGGEAYVSVADGFFVQGGYINAETFYTQLVPVANALPGPILVKIASGIGFLFGAQQFGTGAAWALGAVTAALAVAVCCSVALLVLQVYEVVETSAFIQNLKQYILPVICGMLLSTSCSMLHEACKITGEKGIPNGVALIVILCCVALLRVLHKKFHIHDIILLLACAGIALASLTLLLLITTPTMLCVSWVL